MVERRPLEGTSWRNRLLFPMRTEAVQPRTDVAENNHAADIWETSRTNADIEPGDDGSSTQNADRIDINNGELVPMYIPIMPNSSARANVTTPYETSQNPILDQPAQFSENSRSQLHTTASTGDIADLRDTPQFEIFTDKPTHQAVGDSPAASLPNAGDPNFETDLYHSTRSQSRDSEDLHHSSSRLESTPKANSTPAPSLRSKLKPKVPPRSVKKPRRSLHEHTTHQTCHDRDKNDDGHEDVAL